MLESMQSVVSLVFWDQTLFALSEKIDVHFGVELTRENILEGDILA